MYLGFVRLQAKSHCEIEDMLGSLMGVHCKHMPHARPPHRQVRQKLIGLASSALPKQYIAPLYDLVNLIAHCYYLVAHSRYCSAKDSSYSYTLKV